MRKPKSKGELSLEERSALLVETDAFLADEFVKLEKLEHSYQNKILSKKEYKELEKVRAAKDEIKVRMQFQFVENEKLNKERGIK